MRKHLIISLTVASSIVGNAQNNFTITHLTKNVYHRYYLINRLTPALDFISLKKNAYATFCFDAICENRFTHPEIKDTVHTTIQQKKLSPMIHCWDKFCSYRFINDAAFEAEFIQLTLMICHSIDSTEIACKGSDHLKSIPSITTDDIANTFYTSKRLKKPIDIICQVYNQSATEVSNIFDENEKSSFFEEIKQSPNKRVQQCIEDIHATKSFDPIKKVYTESTQYRYAGDDSFLREQLSLLFFAYKTMLNKKLSNQTEQVIMHEMEDIQYISTNIDDFSVDQVLITIDMMTDRLSTIHNLQKKEQANNKKLLYVLSVPAIAMISAPIIYYLTQS